jgi:hypothetical protein
MKGSRRHWFKVSTIPTFAGEIEKKNHENSSQDIRWAGRVSNLAPTDYKSKAPLEPTCSVTRVSFPFSCLVTNEFMNWERNSAEAGVLYSESVMNAVGSGPYGSCSVLATNWSQKIIMHIYIYRTEEEESNVIRFKIRYPAFVWRGLLF